MPLLQVEVSTNGNIGGYWIWIDEVELDMQNDQGSTHIDQGIGHFLSWHIVGDPGSSISIEGTVDGNTVVQVKKSTVRDDGVGHGVRPFTI